MDRHITFGSKITLNYKPVRGLGVREVVLMGAAAAQAVYWVFLAEDVAFVVRLSIALFLAIMLLAIAVVPVRGQPVEHFLFIMLRGMVRPRRYLHQTAAHSWPDMGGQTPPATGAPLRTAPQARPLTRVWEAIWTGPNLALILALFWMLVIAGSVMVYASHTRSLTGAMW